MSQHPLSLPPHLLPEIQPPRYRSACDACRSKKVRCVPAAADTSAPSPAASSSSTPQSASSDSLSPEERPVGLQRPQQQQQHQPPPCAPCLRNQRVCTFGRRTPRRATGKKVVDLDSGDESEGGGGKKGPGGAAAKRMGPRAQVTASLRARIRETERELRRVGGVVGEGGGVAEIKNGEEGEGEGGDSVFDAHNGACSSHTTHTASTTSSLHPTIPLTQSQITHLLTSPAPPYGYLLSHVSVEGVVNCFEIGEGASGKERRKKSKSAKELFWPWCDVSGEVVSVDECEGYLKNFLEHYRTNPIVSSLVDIVQRGRAVVHSNALIRNVVYGLGAVLGGACGGGDTAEMVVQKDEEDESDHDGEADDEDDDTASSPCTHNPQTRAEMFFRRARQSVMKCIEKEPPAVGDVAAVLGCAVLGWEVGRGEGA
ncbi:hypothetical protein HDV00_002688, partial [Rhizophlyctis rosea]